MVRLLIVPRAHRAKQLPRRKQTQLKLFNFNGLKESIWADSNLKCDSFKCYKYKYLNLIQIESCRMNNYTQLTMQDRCHFLTLLDMALPMAEIARRMNYHRSSLYRELRRNRKQEQRYSPKLANEQALARKDRP